MGRCRWVLAQVNTVAVVHANKAMNHTEGGWPKEVDCTEAEHVIRYRKKVLRGATASTAATRQAASSCSPFLAGERPSSAGGEG